MLGKEKKPQSHKFNKKIENPVVAEDGNTYEHDEIKQWLEEHDTSPETGQSMGKTLLDNHAYAQQTRQSTKKESKISVKELRLKYEKLETKYETLVARQNLYEILSDERDARYENELEATRSLAIKETRDSVKAVKSAINEALSIIAPPFGLIIGGFCLSSCGAILWSSLYGEEMIAAHIDLFGPDCILPCNIAYGTVTLSGLVMMGIGIALLVHHGTACCAPAETVDHAPDTTVSNNTLREAQQTVPLATEQALQQQ